MTVQSNTYNRLLCRRYFLLPYLFCIALNGFSQDYVYLTVPSVGVMRYNLDDSQLDTVVRNDGYNFDEIVYDSSHNLIYTVRYDREIYSYDLDTKVFSSIIKTSGSISDLYYDYVHNRLAWYNASLRSSEYYNLSTDELVKGVDNPGDFRNVVFDFINNQTFWYSRFVLLSKIPFVHNNSGQIDTLDLFDTQRFISQAAYDFTQNKLYFASIELTNSIATHNYIEGLDLSTNERDTIYAEFNSDGFFNQYFSIDYTLDQIHYTRKNQNNYIVQDLNDDSSFGIHVTIESPLFNSTFIHSNTYYSGCSFAGLGLYEIDVYKTSNRISLQKFSSFLSSHGLPRGIDIDTINQKIYWLDNASKKVYNADYDGSNISVVFDVFNATSLRSLNIFDIELDSENGVIYWVSDEFNGDRIYKSTLDGSTHEVLLDNLFNVRELSLDKENDKIYFTQQGSIGLYSSSLNSPSVMNEFTELSFQLYITYDSAIDGIYWTNEITNTVNLYDIDMGTNTQITNLSFTNGYGIDLDERSKQLFIRTDTTLSALDVASGNLSQIVQFDFDSDFVGYLKHLKVNQEVACVDTPCNYSCETAVEISNDTIISGSTIHIPIISDDSECMSDSVLWYQVDGRDDLVTVSLDYQPNQNLKYAIYENDCMDIDLYRCLRFGSGDVNSFFAHAGKQYYITIANRTPYTQDSFYFDIRREYCPDFIEITDAMLAESQHNNFKANEILQSGATIGDSAVAFFQSANSILLTMGFTLDQGSSLEANIDDCPE